MRKGILALSAALMALAAVAATPAQAAPPTDRSTVVTHGYTFSVFYPDDICGPRAGTTTFTHRTQVLHVTENADGSFNYHFTQTGTYHVDFLDPSIADQDSQFTESVHHVLTPGQAQVIQVTFHDFPTGIKIWERLVMTFVGDDLVVDREFQRVEGCP